MSSQRRRLIDPVTKRRYHPAGSVSIVGPAGRGGPDPGGGLLGPAVPLNPFAPGSPGANAAGQQANAAANAATKAIGDALGSAAQASARELLYAGEVLVGVLLIVVGLLLATGLAGRAARATPQGRALRLLRR